MRTRLSFRSLIAADIDVEEDQEAVHMLLAQNVFQVTLGWNKSTYSNSRLDYSACARGSVVPGVCPGTHNSELFHAEIESRAV